LTSKHITKRTRQPLYTVCSSPGIIDNLLIATLLQARISPA
jgi:hypothetical protein